MEGKVNFGGITIIIKISSESILSTIWVFCFRHSPFNLCLNKKLIKESTLEIIDIVFCFYEKRKEKKTSEHDMIDSKDAILVSLKLLFKNNNFKCKTTLFTNK